MPNLTSLANAPVIFERVDCGNGYSLGVVTLNAEKTLNALTLHMVELLLEQLDTWQHDDTLAGVFIMGAGEKAFCAGGDVQALYQSATNNPGGPCDYAETFFAKEYQLDYLLHNYQKPVVCWGNGIVMGGGLGIFAACSHRLVTPTTRLAMPEITIALYPDVGGSWFLNRMPGHVGMFLALTGATVNATDSLFIGIAEHFITTGQDALIEALCSQPWVASTTDNHAMLTQFFSTLSTACQHQLPKANIQDNQATIEAVCASEDIFSIAAAVNELNSEDKWLQRAKKTFLAGSPLSALIIQEQLQRARNLSLADVFKSELALSTNIVRYPEFAEGVRALLIDKDNKPQWQYANIQEVPAEVVTSFFTTPEFPAPWPHNPLENL